MTISARCRDFNVNTLDGRILEGAGWEQTPSPRQRGDCPGLPIAATTDLITRRTSFIRCPTPVHYSQQYTIVIAISEIDDLPAGKRPRPAASSGLAMVGVRTRHTGVNPSWRDTRPASSRWFTHRSYSYNWYGLLDARSGGSRPT